MDAHQLVKVESNPNIPQFGSGDTVKVNYRVREGDRQRIFFNLFLESVLS